MARRKKAEKYHLDTSVNPPVIRWERNKALERSFKDPACSIQGELKGYTKNDTGLYFYGELIFPNPRKKPTAEAVAQLLLAKSKTISPVKSAPEIDLREIEKYETKIVASWHKYIASILDVAKLCDDAKLNLSQAELTELKGRLPFDNATFSKLARIGETSHFYKEEIKPRLPSKFSVLYELSLLDDKPLLEAVENGTVHPKVSRDEILNLKSKSPHQVPNHNDDALYLPARFYAVIVITEDASPQAMRSLHEWLDEGRNLSAVQRLTDRREVDDRRRKKQVLSLVQKGARKIANEAVPIEFKKAERKNKAVQITSRSSLEDVKKVLETVYRPDWYPLLLEAAECAVPNETVANRKPSVAKNKKPKKAA